MLQNDTVGFSSYSEGYQYYAKKFKPWRTSNGLQLRFTLHNHELVIRAKNVDPLQVIVFVDSPLKLFGLPLRSNTHHRERGRKPLSQARFNAKRGENQGFLPTIAVESDLRFPPQFRPSIHDRCFPVRLLREPLHGVHLLMGP